MMDQFGVGPVAPKCFALRMAEQVKSSVQKNHKIIWGNFLLNGVGLVPD